MLRRSVDFSAFISNILVWAQAIDRNMVAIYTRRGLASQVACCFEKWICAMFGEVNFSAILLSFLIVIADCKLATCAASGVARRSAVRSLATQYSGKLESSHPSHSHPCSTMCDTFRTSEPIHLIIETFRKDTFRFTDFIRKCYFQKESRGWTRPANILAR